MKKISSSLVLLITILTFAACSQGGSKTPPDDDALGNLTGPVIECTKNDDCVVVEIGCCDHCNGGEVASVNAAYAEEVEEYHTDDCDEQAMCTMMACPDELPRCREGKCEHYTDTSWLETE